MQADCSWRHAKSVSSLQTCCHLQSTRSGFFYKHRPQPKSDIAFIYLSQQVGTPAWFFSPFFSLRISDLSLLNVCHRATTQSPSWTAPPVIALQNGLVSWVELEQTKATPPTENKVQGNWLSFCFFAE